MMTLDLIVRLTYMHMPTQCYINYRASMLSAISFSATRWKARTLCDGAIRPLTLMNTSYQWFLALGSDGPLRWSEANKHQSTIIDTY